MLPNLIVIGARKCGTTSLHHYLDQHPEISMSRPKELNFFNSRNWRDKLSWYESHFDGQTKVRGEGTPAYSSYPCPPGVVERMHELIPRAKLIYLVGDPLKRIEAQWVQWYAGEVDRCETARDKQMAARPLNEVLTGFDDPSHPYVAPSRYATQLERYLRAFDQSQMLVLDQEDLRASRAETLRGIFRFLSVDENFVSAAFSAELNSGNEKRRVTDRYSRARRALLRQGAGRIPARLRAPMARPLRQAFSHKVERPGIGVQILPGLFGLLHEEAERLRALTGQPFASWSV